MFLLGLYSLLDLSNEPISQLILYNKEDDRFSSSKGDDYFTSSFVVSQLGLVARKPVFGGLRTTQAQTSLRICAV